MGFLAPWFLVGAAAVGLPIWLHFLRRNRTNPQPFSSLMFFERRTETSVQPRRLRYLVLLALRMALLVLLALAFANPFITRTSVSAARKQLAVIVIDRSFSMRDSDHMERARTAALNVLNNLPSGTLVEVAALDSHLESLTQPDVERESAKSAIASVQPTDLASSYAEFVRALRAIQQNTGMMLNVHLVSDMQQSSMPAAFADLQLGAYTTLAFHSVGAKQNPNWAVESVTGTAHVYEEKHTRLSATIAGFQTDTATKKASLWLDGKLLESKDIAVPASGRARVEFVSFPVGYGAHRAEIKIEPHDALAADDTLGFPVERSDRRTVLFLSDGHPRDSFYFKAAMESSENTGLNVQAENIQQAGGEDFSHYAFTVLSDCGSLDESLGRRLDNYVRHGGSLLVLLGPESTRSGRTPIGGIRLSPNTETQGAASVDNGYPALAGLGQLPNVQFFVAARMNVPPGARALANLADGSALLVEQTLGEGRVLTFASTLDNVGNDFPLHKSFLPFVAQTGRYLADTDDTAAEVVAGYPVELRRSRQSGAAADVTGPDGKHELSLHEAAAALDFVPQTEGFYEIHRANGQRSLIAVHADRKESDLTPVASETLGLWCGTGNMQTPAAAGGEERQIHPEPFWRFLLILLVGAGLVESVFASRYLREERGRHDSPRTTERVLAKT